MIHSADAARPQVTQAGDVPVAAALPIVRTQNDIDACVGALLETGTETALPSSYANGALAMYEWLIGRREHNPAYR